jgi:sugar phosphate isomerase/epimerase
LRVKEKAMEKLGVVSTIWAKCLLAGDRFEDLALCFGREGFSDIEIRDGDYLRNSDFGLLLSEIEKVSEHYPAAAWKGVCEALSAGGDPAAAIRPVDRPFFERIRRFQEKTLGITFTYALQHPWLSRPDDEEAHDRRIISAKKLAFLFSSPCARMRLVDLSSPEPIDTSAAAANLGRYLSLASEIPVIQAVENSNKSALLTWKIAAGAGFFMIYDEANLYLPGGRILEPPVRFWESLAPRSLVSVHLKQKSAEGILPHLGPGRVDLSGILSWVRKISFTGDLLLENAAAENPLQEAEKSRNYLLGLAGI